MLGEEAILDSQDIDHNPIHRPADPGEPAVKLVQARSCAWLVIVARSRNRPILARSRDGRGSMVTGKQP